MRFFHGGFRGACSAGAVVMMALVVAGCSEDPGLQERVNRLQAEMQEKERQLQDAQSALEKTKSELKSARAASASANKPAPADRPAPGSSPSFLAREQVEESYTTASKAMQKRLAGELKSYTVENCSEFPVVMPSDDFPYHSKVVLTFRSDIGRAYRLEFPVSADGTGKWNFPNSSDVAGALSDSRSLDTNNTAANPPANTPAATPTATATPRVAQNNPTPTPASSRPTGPNNSSVVPGQAANETRVIDWGDNRGKNNNSRPDRSPTPASVSNTPASVSSAPAGNATPVPAMQADKDVKIHW